MYHGVGEAPEDWVWRNLVISRSLFEKQIDLLTRNSYVSISLDDLREQQEAGTDGDARQVILTFDDGYLDNWVIAYPLLARAGWQGTIYVNPDFIDPGDEVRPTLEDVWAGRCAEEDLQLHGFLNRAELRRLHESGVMTIASHSMTHTWYQTGPQIVDHHRPDRNTPWLAWNARPDRKYAYLTEDQSDIVPFGTPIPEHGRSLAARRWYPGDGEGREETDEEMMARFREEIQGSKSILEETIGAEVAHFAWPGGAYRDESWQVAEEAGYRTICVNSRDEVRWVSSDPRLVRRIGCGKFVSLFGARFPTDDPVHLLHECEATLGRTRRVWEVRLRKLLTAARARFRPYDSKGSWYRSA